VRCFLAVEIPDAARAALARLQDELRQATRLPVRWMEPSAMHLTLKFLGDANDEQQEALGPVLADAMASRCAPEIELAGAGAFPGARRVRVVWAGLAGGGAELTELAGALDGASVPLGFARESRPFRPHVTLGRVRTPQPALDLSAALQARRDVALASWTPAAVTLVESLLGPSGARYRPLRSWAFAARESES
jgi:2'-5' RNA ligase